MTVMSNFWEDKYLFIYTLIICTGKVIPLILWSTTNSIHPLTEPTFVIGSAEFPHYVTTVHCICKKTSSTLWLIATQLFSALLLLAVVFLAIQTRHVKTSIYKPRYQKSQRLYFYRYNFYGDRNFLVDILSRNAH